MISSAHDNLILSGVAGEMRLNVSRHPWSALADFSASLIAKKTELPMNKGGSPTPYNSESYDKEVKEEIYLASLDGL